MAATHWPDGPQKLKGVLHDALDAISAAHSGVTDALEIPTPHCDLAFKNQRDLIVTTTRAFSGAAAIPLWYAQRLAKEGLAVRYMSDHDPVGIAARLLCDAAGVDPGDIRAGVLGDWQFARLEAAVTELGKHRLVLAPLTHMRLTLGTQLTVVDGVSTTRDRLEKLLSALDEAATACLVFRDGSQPDTLRVEATTTLAGLTPAPCALGQRLVQGQAVAVRYGGPVRRQLQLWG